MASLAASPGAWSPVYDLAGEGRIAVWDSGNSRAFIGGDNGIRYTTDQGATFITPSVGVTTGDFGAMVGGYVMVTGNQTKAVYTSFSGNVYAELLYTNPNAIMERAIGGVDNGLVHFLSNPNLGMARVDPANNTVTDITATFQAVMNSSTVDCNGGYLPQQGVTVIGGRNGQYVISTDDNLTFSLLDMSIATVAGPMTAVVETSAGRCIAVVGERVYYSDDVTNSSSWTEGQDLSVIPGVTWGEGNIIASSTDSDITLISGRQSGAEAIVVSTDNGSTWALDTSSFTVPSTEFISQMCYAGNDTFFALTNANKLYIRSF